MKIFSLRSFHHQHSGKQHLKRHRKRQKHSPPCHTFSYSPKCMFGNLVIFAVLITLFACSSFHDGGFGPKNEHQLPVQQHKLHEHQQVRLAVCITGQLQRLELKSKIAHIFDHNRRKGHLVDAFFVLDLDETRPPFFTDSILQRSGHISTAKTFIAENKNDERQQAHHRAIDGSSGFFYSLSEIEKIVKPRVDFLKIVSFSQPENPVVPEWYEQRLSDRKSKKRPAYNPEVFLANTVEASGANIHRDVRAFPVLPLRLGYTTRKGKSCLKTFYKRCYQNAGLLLEREKTHLEVIQNKQQRFHSNNGTKTAGSNATSYPPPLC